MIAHGPQSRAQQSDDASRQLRVAVEETLESYGREYLNPDVTESGCVRTAGRAIEDGDLSEKVADGCVREGQLSPCSRDNRQTNAPFEDEIYSVPAITLAEDHLALRVDSLVGRRLDRPQDFCGHSLE